MYKIYYSREAEGLCNMVNGYQNLSLRIKIMLFVLTFNVSNTRNLSRSTDFTQFHVVNNFRR